MWCVCPRNAWERVIWELKHTRFVFAVCVWESLCVHVCVCVCVTLVDCAVSVLSVGRWKEWWRGSERHTYLTCTHIHAHICPHTLLSLALLRQAGGGENSAMTVSFLSITRVWATHIHTLLLLLCGELPAWGIRPYLGHKDGVHIIFVTYLTFTHTYTQLHTPEISYVMSEE